MSEQDIIKTQTKWTGTEADIQSEIIDKLHYVVSSSFVAEVTLSTQKRTDILDIDTGRIGVEVKKTWLEGETLLEFTKHGLEQSRSYYIIIPLVMWADRENRNVKYIIADMGNPIVKSMFESIFKMYSKKFVDVKAENLTEDKFKELITKNGRNTVLLADKRYLIMSYDENKDAIFRSFFSTVKKESTRLFNKVFPPFRIYLNGYREKQGLDRIYTLLFPLFYSLKVTDDLVLSITRNNRKKIKENIEIIQEFINSINLSADLQKLPRKTFFETPTSIAPRIAMSDTPLEYPETLFNNLYNIMKQIDNTKIIVDGKEEELRWELFSPVGLGDNEYIRKVKRKSVIKIWDILINNRDAIESVIGKNKSEQEVFDMLFTKLVDMHSQLRDGNLSQEEEKKYLTILGWYAWYFITYLDEMVKVSYALASENYRMRYNESQTYKKILKRVSPYMSLYSRPDVINAVTLTKIDEYEKLYELSFIEVINSLFNGIYEITMSQYSEDAKEGKNSDIVKLGQIIEDIYDFKNLLQWFMISKFGTDRLPSYIDVDFNADYPAVRIYLDTEKISKILRKLKKGEIDLEEAKKLLMEEKVIKSISEQSAPDNALFKRLYKSLSEQNGLSYKEVIRIIEEYKEDKSTKLTFVEIPDKLYKKVKLLKEFIEEKIEEYPILSIFKTSLITAEKFLDMIEIDPETDKKYIRDAETFLQILIGAEDWRRFMQMYEDLEGIEYENIDELINSKLFDEEEIDVNQYKEFLENHPLAFVKKTINEIRARKNGLGVYTSSQNFENSFKENFLTYIMHTAVHKEKYSLLPDDEIKEAILNLTLILEKRMENSFIEFASSYIAYRILQDYGYNEKHDVLYWFSKYKSELEDKIGDLGFLLDDYAPYITQHLKDNYLTKSGSINKIRTIESVYTHMITSFVTASTLLGIKEHIDNLRDINNIEKLVESLFSPLEYMLSHYIALIKNLERNDHEEIIRREIVIEKNTEQSLKTFPMIYSIEKNKVEDEYNFLKSVKDNYKRIFDRNTSMIYKIFTNEDKEKINNGIREFIYNGKPIFAQDFFDQEEMLLTAIRNMDPIFFINKEFLENVYQGVYINIIEPSDVENEILIPYMEKIEEKILATLSQGKLPSINTIDEQIEIIRYIHDEYGFENNETIALLESIEEHLAKIRELNKIPEEERKNVIKNLLPSEMEER